MRRAARLVLSLPYLALAAAQQPDVVNPDSAVLKEFNRRVSDYVKVHKDAQSAAHRLKPTGSQQAIKEHEHQFAERIRAARQGAAQGNIFAPEIAQEFRRLVSVTMRGPQAARIRRSFESAAPVHLRTLRVDSAYPSTVPLQSTPPSLLLNLPPLPPQVEYRVAGHSLVLRDTEANLVVDFIPNAIP
jgi:hypothetical protein